ncbi:hypothetical protein K7I13_03455 [Brucepastera parasyntrophica]|uniref:hypothetical protein n=1 Tax=Brucepastera parasyntrophica TaxID=2880008 RepID=UPI00210B96D9|nr:hypothetical protein [Brucepastera parasyntrophica]ULQ60377.1 hypothetical protein K7I13_03455 [Brucepastera parasyntrophica]
MPEQTEKMYETEIAEALEQGKIYCANCIHCKLVPSPANSSGQFYLRVRCAAGKWNKKMGGEKLYKYFTVTRRSIDCCDSYEPMGDAADFISDLKKTLPIKDEIYE